MQEMSRKVQDCNELTVEEHWSKIKEAIITTARETLGMRRQQRKEEWFDDECRKAIEDRNILHRRYVQRRTRERKEEFGNARRKADRICRKKKRQYLNNQLEQGILKTTTHETHIGI